MVKKKYSKYNVDIYLNEKVLLYNSITDNFLVIEPFLFELLIAARNEDKILDIENIHKAFYNELSNKGFIVNADVNEYNYIKNKILETDYNLNDFTLIINPTMNCNFNCWYCYEEHIKSSKMSQKTIESVKLLIDKMTYNGRIKNLYLGWFGGEPLLNYDQVMLPILTYAHEISEKRKVNFYSDITTNGFLIREEMIDTFKKYNLDFFQITLDGNKAKHDKIRYVNKKRGSYDKIIENIKLLTLNNLKVNVRINFTEETLDGLDEIIKDLQEGNSNYLTIDMHQVWQTKNDNDRIHNTSFFNRIKKIKEEFRYNNLDVANNTVSYINDSCYADKFNEVVINYNGDIYKCTARDFNKENRLGYLDDQGNLIWNLDQHNTRQLAKLNNKPCQECPILPICGSGCSEYAYQNINEDYCVHDFDINKKKELVLDHFYELIATKESI